MLIAHGIGTPYLVVIRIDIFVDIDTREKYWYFSHP